MSSTLSTEPVSPKATPLPPLPSEDPLTSQQWKTLLAIADAVIPAIKPMSTAKTRTEIAATDTDYSTAISKLRALTPENDPDAVTAVKDYLDDYASQDPAFRAELQRVFAMYMPQNQRKELCMVLNVLNTRAGSLALTGYLTPISEQPAHVRESIIQGWATARLGALRQLRRSLVIITKQAWIKTSPALRRVIGAPRVPLGMKPGKGFDYEFIQIPPGDKPEVIETDVVIVGSGSVSVVAGQSMGGGGTVNWSASLQTQGYVRHEWAGRGLPFFTSAEFQESLDRVCDRMGVSDKNIKQNRNNEILLEGARKLGWTAKPVPQNTGGQQHYCGYCNFGCGSCEKQGPVVSFLPDAARAGAKFIEGFHAERVIFSNKNGRKIATGVLGTWTSRDAHGGVAGSPLTTRRVLIKAKRVVVSAGTMQSPLLLMRSGLKNPQIGRNLYLHPVTFLGAYHKEEIKPWEGGILTAVVGEFENMDGKGHGVKLEATNMVPSACLMWVDWKSAMQYKIDAAKLKHMVGYISIARDRDTGRVYPDPVDGRVRFSYQTSKFDQKHVLEGVIALAKIQYVEGAQEIFTVIPNMRPFVRDPSMPAGDGINDPEFQTWIQDIRNMGLPSPESVYVSAHQMGTCRMSAKEKDGVVDPRGAVWGTEGLYVADASVFPSASGVNPMVTNMAISDWISRGIKEGMEERPRL
ncbi:unnamed protein product [Alternaria alternata]